MLPKEATKGKQGRPPGNLSLSPIEEIFKPLGMTRSSHGHNTEVVPGRVEGYDKMDEGYRRSQPGRKGHAGQAGEVNGGKRSVIAPERGRGSRRRHVREAPGCASSRPGSPAGRPVAGPG